MELNVKYFSELELSELYDILKLRSDVFVVEQNCAYPDLDNLDQDSVHIYLYDEGELLAYCRLIPENDRQGKITRVVTSKRREGYGSIVVKEALRVAKEDLLLRSLYLDGQSYAINFYQSFGFETSGEEFLEDGIPHIRMNLTL